MASLFFSYSHKDEDLRDQLDTHLTMLKRQGVIDAWHDRRIDVGEEFAQKIGDHVENDQVILLLVSPDFLASSYCYDIEMSRALQRHDAGEAIVIPVILRACEWEQTPFGKITATPLDGRPVTQWPDRDQGFLEVVKAIRRAVETLTHKECGRKVVTSVQARPSPLSGLGVVTDAPRSSNLALAKRFTDLDRDKFRADAFEYIASYFRNSLAELEARTFGIEGTFRRVVANRFYARAFSR